MRRLPLYKSAAGFCSSVTVESSAIDDREWVHFAAVYDGSTANLFVDGIIKAAASIPSASLEIDEIPKEEN